ncbi:helix-turn-helix domain-containing protein [Frankia sp. R43]|uniref:helix-turn-helix domain-containing protein n=1 Tax=Frankia sp. R43 TaxID=269536 RepID=UPI00350F2C98
MRISGSEAGDHGWVVLVRLGYSFRLYPSAGQWAALAKVLGCARVPCPSERRGCRYRPIKAGSSSLALP